MECTECEGGGNIKTQDWPSMLKLSNYVVIEANPKQKNALWRFFVSNKMLPVQSSAQEPISYFSYQECSVHVRPYAYAYSRNLEKNIWRSFSYFLKSFLSLNRDKYFALYWCFCVRISFILLLIKWSEMDPNVKPQTLVETFDQANSNSIPEYMSGLS